MTEPSERDLLAAVKALYPGADQAGPFDEKERRIAAAITAAREEGRQEERWSCIDCGKTFADIEEARRHFIGHYTNQYVKGLAAGRREERQRILAILHQGNTTPDDRSLSDEEPTEEQ